VTEEQQDDRSADLQKTANQFMRKVADRMNLNDPVTDEEDEKRLEEEERDKGKKAAEIMKSVWPKRQDQP
jgi:hypothetical protein